MLELQRRGLSYRYVDSGQHAKVTQDLRKAFGLNHKGFSLRKADTNITTISEAITWAGRQALACIIRRNWIRNEVFPEGGICLIHGDTLSTLLGLEMARTAGLDVAHIEAGLSSLSLLEPFPEEIIRRWCSRRADILFSPSAQATINLKAMNVKGRIFEVGGNTIVDTLRLSERVACQTRIPEQPYAVVTCHRAETITRPERLKKVVSLIRQGSRRILMLFVVHNPTFRYLQKFGLMARLAVPNIRVLSMQGYFDFINLVKKSQFVMTDGGSIQEECAYLNKPCLVLRCKTERHDGLGRNAVLWMFNEEIGRKFLANYEDLVQQRPPVWPSPSEKIVDVLVENGYGRASHEDG